jgi:kynureninase
VTGTAVGFEASDAWALDADRGDPPAWTRSEFALPVGSDGAPLVYMSGNSLGLMPKQVPELILAELEDWARLGVEGHFEARTPWYSYHEQFREPLARLAGARPDEVVAMNGLTVNLHLMMVSFYRPVGARRLILIEDSAFPSDRYAVATHLRSRGQDPAECLFIARPHEGEATLRTEDLEALLQRRGAEIALVLLSGVQYYTGQRFEIDRITAAAHGAGCLVGFDLAHAIGNVELELHRWGVDFAAWCSYKYLNAGPGAVAGCFVHQRHGENADIPRLAGWWGNDPATRFRMHLNEEFVPRSGADGWQLSNPPVLAMTPLRASLALFDRVGMPALRAKAARLTGYLEYLIDQRPLVGLELLTPRDPAQRGCQLSYRVRRGGKPVLEALRDRGVVADLRQPDVIRLAPVPLYSTFADVRRAAAALLDACA